MLPSIPSVRLTEAQGRTVLAVHDGYEVRDEIKDAGGRFDSTTKAWLLTEDSPKHLARVAAAIRRLGGDPTLLDYIVRGGTLAAAKDIASPVTGEAEQVFTRPRNTGHLEAEPDDDLHHFPVPLYPYQRVGARFARSRQGSLIADEMGLGKAQSLDARILTPTGWTRMGDISVGDEVIGADGTATVVTGVFPQGKRPVYRVTFNDGASVECDAEHLWQVSTSSYISEGRPWRVMTTTELASDLRHPSGKRKWRIPVLSAPVEYDPIALPLDAYVLGALIGDGSLKQGTYFSSGDQYIVDEMQRLLPHGHFMKKLSSGYNYSITANSPFVAGANLVRNALRDVGLLGTGSESKFIPEIYLRASVAERIALLQGLLDTDGHACGNRARVEFSTTSERLARDVIDLVEGLGGTTRYGVSRTTHLPSHRIAVILPNEIPPFRLPRKAEVVRPRVKNLPSRVISSIEYVDDRPTQCIAVAADDHLYVTDRHVVTHNTRQALAAAALDHRVLIVCPSVTKTHWKHEAAAALECEPVVLAGGKAQFIEPDTRVVVVNYDILAKHVPMLTAWAPTTVILDEAHMVKNPKSQRTKALMGFVKAVKPRVIALTGTPIMNRPVELIPILQMTGAFETVGKNWITYVKTFCNAKQTQWGWDTSGASNLDVLAQRLHDSIMIRRTKAEVLTDLPPKSRRVLELDLEASLADYKAAEKAATEAFEGRVAQIMKEKGISAAKAIKEATKEPDGAAQIAELRLQVGLAKMDAAAGAILEHLESTGRKAVVFAHHHEVRAGLRQRFTDAGYRVVEIGGETSQKQRDDAIEAFQNDPSVKVFLGSTAASVGITLTAASDVFLVEQQWTPAILDQSEDRVYRIGQEADSVTAWHLIAPACAVDMHMWRTVERKRSITAHALGDEDAPKAERHGGRGVAGYVASLLAQSKKKSRISVSEDDIDAEGDAADEQ